MYNKMTAIKVILNEPAIRKKMDEWSEHMVCALENELLSVPYLRDEQRYADDVIAYLNKYVNVGNVKIELKTIPDEGIVSDGMQHMNRVPPLWLSKLVFSLTHAKPISDNPNLTDGKYVLGIQRIMVENSHGPQFNYVRFSEQLSELYGHDVVVTYDEYNRGHTAKVDGEVIDLNSRPSTKRRQ